MTQTTTIAVSIIPLGKLLQDYLSQTIFAELLPIDNRQSPYVLNYLEGVNLSKNRKLYFKLLFAFLIVFFRPLLSFSRPFPFLSSDEKLKELKKLQSSRWYFVRTLFDLLKSHSLTALFKDPSIRENWNADKPTSSVATQAHSIKSNQIAYDFIVIGKEGFTTANAMAKTGKKVLLIGEKEILADDYDHLSNTKIEKVLFEGTRAVAVETSNGVFTAHSEIVLAAGALETPALLLRSGLKNPQIGKNLQVHLSISCLGLLPDERTQSEGISQRIEISQLEKSGIYLSRNKLPLEVMLSKIPYVRDDLNRLKERHQNLTSWMASIKTNTRGSIGITRRGEPYTFFSPTYEDMEKVRAAMNKLCQILFQLNAVEVYPGISGKLNILKNFNQTGEIRAISPQPRYFKMELIHQIGTCKVGKDPRTSVVDPNFKVHGTENLYCTGSCIL